MPSPIFVRNLQNVCPVCYLMVGKVCTHLNRCQRIISWLRTVCRIPGVKLMPKVSHNVGVAKLKIQMEMCCGGEKWEERGKEAPLKWVEANKLRTSLLKNFLLHSWWLGTTQYILFLALLSVIYFNANAFAGLCMGYSSRDVSKWWIVSRHYLRINITMTFVKDHCYYSLNSQIA